MCISGLQSTSPKHRNGKKSKYNACCFHSWAGATVTLGSTLLPRQLVTVRYKFVLLLIS